MARTKSSMTAFFILWGGQAVSLFGSSLVQFALIWWLTETTGSATTLSAAVLVGIVPDVVLGPMIGAFVDRWNRKLILFASDAFIALASLFGAYLFWIEAIQVWHIFVLLFVRALGSGFHRPTMIATTSLMVPEAHLTRIQGLNQTLQASLTIVSAPLGALLIEWVSMFGILALDVLSALAALIPLIFIFIPQPTRSTKLDDLEKEPSIWADIAAGFRYIVRRKGLLTIIGLAASVNLLLMPAISLMPILVSEYFEGGALEFAWMQMAVGIGLLVGGILLGVWGGFKQRMVTSLTGLIGIGIGMSFVGLAPRGLLALAIGGIGFTGIMMSFTNGPIQALLQATVAPDYQGRVFTLLGTATRAMAPLGLIIAGPVSDLIGVRFWFLVAGVACLLMGTIGFALPSVMNLERDSKADGTGSTATG